MLKKMLPFFEAREVAMRQATGGENTRPRYRYLEEQRKAIMEVIGVDGGD